MKNPLCITGYTHSALFHNLTATWSDLYSIVAYVEGWGVIRFKRYFDSSECVNLVLQWKNNHVTVKLKESVLYPETGSYVKQFIELNCVRWSLYIAPMYLLRIRCSNKIYKIIWRFPVERTIPSIGGFCSLPLIDVQMNAKYSIYCTQFRDGLLMSPLKKTQSRQSTVNTWSRKFIPVLIYEEWNKSINLPW